MNQQFFWKLQEDIMSEDDINILIDFIKETKRFTQWQKVREFEQAYSAWQGCKYSVYVNSGSSANLLLINSWKTMKGWTVDDEVIVPVVTWTTNICPIMQNGLKPVFVDVNLSDLSFDYEKLEQAITPNTKAIFITHLIGFPADIKKIKEIIGSRDIMILEDCCESQGATIDGVKVGNFGSGGTFSFYWGHHMTSVEGGMICTGDEDLYKMLILKRSHGLARELPEKYQQEIKDKYPNLDFRFLFLTDGFNFRNTEMHAVIGLTQLKKLDGFIRQRNKNYEAFLEVCKKYDDLVLLNKEGISSFTFPFFFKDKIKKDKFLEFLLVKGIESRPLISGNMLRQPFLKEYYNPENFKNADFVHNNAFYIGNNQFVDDDRVKVLASLMQEFFNN